MQALEALISAHFLTTPLHNSHIFEHFHTFDVLLLMAHLILRMSTAFHMSSPNTALHFRTTSPTF